MKLFSSTLPFAATVALAGATPQGLDPFALIAEARTEPVILEIRCGDRLADWGEVRVEGPGGRVVMAPIGEDGRACIAGLAQGWACVRDVRAGTGEREKLDRERRIWCLDPPLHLKGATWPVTLNLSPSFHIQSFGPKLPHMYGTGSATLVRTAGAQGAYVVDECEVEDFLGQVDIPGLRPGDYRVFVPWRQDRYLSTADVRLDGTPRRAGPLDFRTDVVLPENKGKRPPPEGDWLGSSGRTLRGTLLGEDGARLRGGVLTLVRSDLPGPRVVKSGGTSALGDTLEALCDGNGAYEIRGLLGGTYLVSARPYGTHGAGHRDASPVMLFESLRFRDDADGPRILETSPTPASVAMLKGWVDGEIPDGLRVIATPGNALGELEAEVHGDGSFSFGEVPLDEYWIDIPGGDRAMGLCLAAPRVAVAGGEPIEIVPRTSTRLGVVAPFPAPRDSEGWLRVAEHRAGRAHRAGRRLPPPRKVQWGGIGAAVIEGLPPGRFRVTYSETRDSAGDRSPRFALGWIEIPEVPLAEAAVQLEAVTGRSFRLFNDDPTHAMQVDVEDGEGLLFSVEVSSDSDLSIVLPMAAKAVDTPLRAIVRRGFSVEPRAFAIPSDRAYLRCPADDR